MEFQKHSKRRRKIKENPGKNDHHFMGAIFMIVLET
jgi:hypothetical protein